MDVPRADRSGRRARVLQLNELKREHRHAWPSRLETIKQAHPSGREQCVLKLRAHEPKILQGQEARHYPGAMRSWMEKFSV